MSQDKRSRGKVGSSEGTDGLKGHHEDFCYYSNMGIHWRILSSKETWAVFCFNSITPDVILRVKCRESRAEGRPNHIYFLLLR